MIIDESIPGWTSRAKLELFANIATWANRSVGSPRILELGSWAGRSLFVWAYNCPSGTVISVDSSKGYNLRELQQRDPSVFPSMLGDPDKWEMWDTRIEAVRKRTTALLPNVDHFLCSTDEYFKIRCSEQLGFDVIFVDADHTEDAVYADISNGLRLLRPGGILLGDDHQWPGVRAAVRRCADENHLRVWTHSQSDVWALYSSTEHLCWWVDPES